MGHVVGEPISIVSAQSVDGGKPDISITVADDISDEIVGQSVPRINGAKVIIRGVARQRQKCQSHPKSKGTQNFHPSCVSPTNIVIIMLFSFVETFYLMGQYTFLTFDIRDVSIVVRNVSMIQTGKN